MNSLEIKQQLHRYIDLADERMAKVLLAMFKNYFQNSEEQVVAYTTKGKPLSKKQMIKEVMESVNEVNKGNFFTTEEVRENLKNKNK